MTQFSVDFIGIGPQKTGSTWLNKVLACHPSISLPSGTKETMFFDLYYNKGLDWYRDYFSTTDGHKIIGEIGPSYFDFEKSIERIYAINSDCKIIISLRNPISKAISLHRHHLNKGRVSNQFKEAIEKMPRIITSGHYAEYIPRWLDKFTSKQVKLILLDDIQDNPQQVWQEVCQFLQISIIDLPIIASEKINSQMMSKYPWLAKIASEVAIKMREYKLHNLVEKLKDLGLQKIYTGGEERIIPLSDQEYDYLLELYESDIVFVENLMSKDLSHWRQKKNHHE
ncbi:sulfotransferase domain-containing protein [Cyanobacterium sp. DS4]|uniref:sulfotransferase domain-containing protein n=1 Tax=Cyanobacterium sp. DS4 TaxID=2878255 RepID=UPI002E80532C|nr:sulfotransferase domain-containing protein [Cyanobacterium sp. Dongsha4]WVK99931.1 sulfotransferase domain-containing protein [Cyanobacterium sp. Dongsha4]